ncbi:2925_t:CDS:1 [Cetraspora pellucida]|uniref:2925_t:CDS:1 n=1 Tax=Cetraspora pellucida TaxID=1433469 RepID=A0A9N9JH99_9GLOM|nr:2925_t:CDS:1 [Cetraspora pellucida]
MPLNHNKNPFLSKCKKLEKTIQTIKNSLKIKNADITNIDSPDSINIDDVNYILKINKMIKSDQEEIKKLTKNSKTTKNSKSQKHFTQNNKKGKEHATTTQELGSAIDIIDSDQK